MTCGSAADAAFGLACIFPLPCLLFTLLAKKHQAPGLPVPGAGYGFRPGGSRWVGRILRAFSTKRHSDALIGDRTSEDGAAGWNSRNRCFQAPNAVRWANASGMP